jgi:hypothetical protein
MNSARTTSNAPRWKRNQTGDVNALPSFRYVVRTAGEGASISDRASSRLIARAYAGRREPLQGSPGADVVQFYRFCVACKSGGVAMRTCLSSEDKCQVPGIPLSS